MSEMAERKAQREVQEAAERLDRLPVTRLHVAAVAVCGMGMALDTFEISFGSVLSAVFSTPPHRLPANDLGFLLAAVFFAAVVGAPLLGWVADRYGRRNTLIGVLLWIAVASMQAALTQSVRTLAAWRFLAGIALGAYPPIAISYMTDILPARSRGMLIFSGLSLATLGPPAAVFLVRWLTPIAPLGLESWRWALLVGAGMGVLVAALFAAMPESARWLGDRGRTVEMTAECRRFERSRVVAIHVPEARDIGPASNSQIVVEQHSGHRQWASIACLFLLSPWATVTFPMLVGAVLSQKGFKLSETLLYVGLGTLGPLIGTLLAATVIDRIERRLTLAVCALSMVVCGYVFVANDTPWFLVAAIALFNLLVSLYIPTLNVYSAELFPTRRRASSTAIAWSLNRVGAALRRCSWSRCCGKPVRR